MSQVSILAIYLPELKFSYSVYFKVKVHSN